jgi:hypothetical protein
LIPAVAGEIEPERPQTLSETCVTLGLSRQRASLLLSIAVSAICEQIKREIPGDAQAPSLSVAQF